MKPAIQKEILKLKKQLRQHDHLYYNLDQPKITDFEYDKLFKRLLELEAKHPEFKTPDSPSQRIPGQALDKFKKEAHSLAMLSLQNSYSTQEIKAFYERILKQLTKNPSFFVEPKLDGVAVELVYKQGVLIKALTRGDGKTGENITKNIKTLKGLPLVLETKVPLLEVRGEVVIFKKDFKKINEKQEEKGLPLFANPRNLAAGTLRQLDPKVTAKRPLHFFAHSPGNINTGQINITKINSQQEFMKTMKALCLPSLHINSSGKLKPPLNLCRLAPSFKDLLVYYEELLSLRHQLPFEIDGLVIKVNRFEEQKKLGSIARSPRWAIAGKFPPEQGETQIQDIRLQVGRTGVVTPVAVLKPLSLAGVFIRQASLHNFQDLKRKDIRIGDFVLIHRAGDVIPEVIKVLKPKRKTVLKTPGWLKKYVPPSHCPVCQAVLKNQGDYLLCDNKNCPAVKESRLLHFASKPAMNIEFLGEKSIKKFYGWGWLNSYSDIYDLKHKDLKNKEGFGEKSYTLLVSSLEKSKKTQLPRWLFALGIPLIGEQTAQKISDKIYKIGGEDLNIPAVLKILKNITAEELESIPDLGPLAVASFLSAFRDPVMIEDLKELYKRGVYFEKQSKKQGSLKNKSFVITGTLPLPRSQIKQQILNKGGQVMAQVSQNTDFLLEGASPGSKSQKAKKLNIPRLTWEDFLKLIEKKAP